MYHNIRTEIALHWNEDPNEMKRTDCVTKQTVAATANSIISCSQAIAPARQTIAHRKAPSSAFQGPRCLRHQSVAKACKSDLASAKWTANTVRTEPQSLTTITNANYDAWGTHTDICMMYMSALKH